MPLLKELHHFLLEQKYFFVELEVTITNHFIIPVSLNGHEVKMILDTGASHSCLDQKKAATLNLVTDDVDMVTVGIGDTENMQVQMVQIEHLQLGDFHIHDYPFTVLDLKNIELALGEVFGEVCGVIGSELLQKYEGVIDCKTLRLYLKTLPK